MQIFRTITLAALFPALTIVLSNCKKSESSASSPAAESPATNQAPTDGGGEATDPTSGSTSPDDQPDPQDKGEGDGGEPEAPAISGSVGTVMLATAVTDYIVTAYDMKSDGTRGPALGSAQPDANGDFKVALSAQAGTIELALESTAMGLVEAAPIFRTRVAGMTEEKVALNAVTELFVHRSDELLADDKSLADSLLIASTETSVLAGVKSVRQAPLRSIADEAGANAESGRYALILAGLSAQAKRLGVQDLEFLTALKADFADGSVTGSNGRQKLSVGTKEMFESGYENDLRLAMKDAVSQTSGAKVGFNDIPAISGYAAAAVQGLSPEDLESYQPASPTTYAHYFQVRKLTGAETVFTDPNTCLGPFDFVRVNAFGTLINNGPELPIDFQPDSLKGTTPPKAFSDSACTGGNELTSLAIAADTSTSAQFFVKPNSLYSPSLFFSVSFAVIPGVDTAYLTLQAMTGDKRVAVDLGLYLVDDTEKLPYGVNYIGQAGSELQKEVCYAGVLHLTPYVGFLGAAPAAYPTNVNINTLTNLSTFSGGASCAGYPGNAGAIGFYSDAACTNAQSNFTIAAGDEYSLFYIKIPTAYTRCYNSQIDRLFFLGFSTVSPSALGVGYSSYNYYIAE